MLIFRIHTLLALVLPVFVPHTSFGSSRGQLSVGFYKQACPNAESIIRSAVQKAVSVDPQIAPRLLRLSFHDCLVEGCDGSILLDTFNGERDARGNAGLAGFEVIEGAKTELEKACPGVVSCADIIALSARDSIVLSGGPSYEVPTGRRDGRVSNISHADNLPEVDDSIQLLKAKFLEKGLSDRDFVLLSAGGHTIGTTACFFMETRLYDFNGTSGNSDPAINPKFLPRLKSKCPKNGDVNVRLPIDFNSELTFDDHILRNIKQGFAVLASDARLRDDGSTKQILDSYVANRSARSSFSADFANAMVKMGNIDVKTGSQGEIRRVCRAVN